jgi:prophage tail gpP-like protein
MPNPEEVAEVIVNNVRFKDWLSVWVQHRYADAWPQFRFTSAEREPVPTLWDKVQHKPCDRVVITLAGVPAVVGGYIITRQVAYDAKNHQVMLHGVGRTWFAARASIWHTTGNFDGKTLEQTCREIWAPFPVTPEVIGTLDAEPFVKLRHQPGESTWNFAERIARVRKCVLGSTYTGNFLMIGDHVGRITADLIEGKNILKCQCTRTKKDVFGPYIFIGQIAGTDQSRGRPVSEPSGEAKGTPCMYSPLVTPAEQPVSAQAELKKRAEYESQWHEGAVIQASITVQGWLRPGRRVDPSATEEGLAQVIGVKDIWRVGDDVNVWSPMAMLVATNGGPVVLKIQTATFTQDDKSGTLTTLDLVLPWLMNDKIQVDISMPPGYNTAPGPGTTNAPIVVPPVDQTLQVPPPNLEE